MRLAPRATSMLLVFGLLSLGLLATSADAAAPLVGRLGPGDAIFWNTGYVKNASNINTGPDACRQDTCFRYRFEVTKTAERLRVALDYPEGGFMGLALITPDGGRVEPGDSGLYSEELFVYHPKPGIYKVEVQPQIMFETAARLRAKLERAPQDRGNELLLPDLRVEPPYDFSFESNSLASFVVGGPVSSCTTDEMAEELVTRCLRFAVGPQNAGSGPLELRFSPMADAVTTEAPMYQVLHRADGSTSERPAGTYEYHKTHSHYHFSGFAATRLLEVTDRDRGKMVFAGEGRKEGFCFGDVKMNSWNRFIQAPAWSSRSSCESLDDAYMGLSAGWTDVYSADTSGNFVDFGDNGNGYYVLQATVDDAGQVRERSESNNISYAYIKVTGNRVRILERGHGRSPWDPSKQVVVDWVAALKRKG